MKTWKELLSVTASIPYIDSDGYVEAGFYLSSDGMWLYLPPRDDILRVGISPSWRIIELEAAPAFGALAFEIENDHDGLFEFYLDPVDFAERVFKLPQVEDEALGVSQGIFVVEITAGRTSDTPHGPAESYMEMLILGRLDLSGDLPLVEEAEASR